MVQDDQLTTRLTKSCSSEFLKVEMSSRPTRTCLRGLKSNVTGNHHDYVQSVQDYCQRARENCKSWIQIQTKKLTVFINLAIGPRTEPIL